MSWFYILAIFALHIMLFIYMRIIFSYIINHDINLKKLPFDFWLIILIQLIGTSLIVINITPIDIYNKNDLTNVIFILSLATHGLMLFGYLGRKHPFIVKLSAVTTLSVLHLHGVILSDIFASLLGFII